jgi:hypothetical protein
MESGMTKTKKKEDKEASKITGPDKEAEKIKHGYHPDDETGAPKGKNRSNAGEETS